MKNYRNNNMEKLISGLDITPTMYKNAEEKYKNLGKFFEEKGLNCEIYPQGSFRLGTVIRPLKEGKESDYDLDFICLVDSDNKELKASELRTLIKETLESNEIYKEKLVEYDKCLTLNYAEVNGVGFNIDILPAISLNVSDFINVTNKSLKSGNIYWFKINPKAYSKWFDLINSKYTSYEEIRKMNIALENKVEVEDLPTLFKRTSLQRVIQILKHHRDYFYNVKRRENKKVISAIITTLCAEIASQINYTELNIEDLLKKIIEELEIYSSQQTKSEKMFSNEYPGRNILKKENGKWVILNPVNPEDNLADQWNEDVEKPILFFQWISCLRKELLDSNEEEYIVSLENIFGESYVNKNIDTKKYKDTLKNTQQISTSKPWRC